MAFGTPGFALESVLTLDEAKALLGDGVVARATHLDIHAAFIYRQDTRTAVVLAESP